MRRPSIILASIACFSAALVSAATGQQPEGKAAARQPARPGAGREVEPAADLEMAEDLEIMGVVLRAALREAYTPEGVPQSTGGRTLSTARGLYGMVWRGPSDRYSAAASYPSYVANTEAAYRGQPTQPNAVTQAVEYLGWAPEDPAQTVKRRAPETAEGGVVGRPEGAYFDGYGVVYQIALDVAPPRLRRPKETAEGAGAPSRRPDPWEVAARALRGEPAAQPSRGAETAFRPPTKDELVDKLLDVLAENARNFRHLKPQDRLTVAITFPRSKAQPRGKSQAGSKAQTGSGGPTQPAVGSGTSLALAALDEQGAYGDGLAEGRSSQEVSGDLHMRQKNYQKAIEAYEKALKVSPMKRSLSVKLAQAYLAAGELEKAQKMIEKARASDSQNRQKTPPSAASREIPLPAKFILSVPKSRLDDVAAGKLKREELKEHATVDYFNPPADRPGLGSQTRRRPDRAEVGGTHDYDSTFPYRYIPRLPASY